MLHIQIKQLLSQKGITKPYTWLRKIGISHSMAHKLLSDKHERIELKTLALICEKAWCTPNDFFTWVPNNPIEDIANHPMQAIKPKPTTQIANYLTRLNLEQLREIEQEIIKKL